MKTGDLVHVPPVRTVVRLADLGDQHLRRHMVETFILTGEVSFAISTILNKIAIPKGEGFFVIGNYGSGKSHLLNILSLILSDAEAREVFTASGREGRPAEGKLTSLLQRAAETNPLVVEISLVEHSNREYLEQIVLSRVEEKLRGEAPSEKAAPALPPGWLNLPRPEAFQTLRQGLAQGGWGGLVLLIDELSEFLRSKDSARAYNEDVRFLQYLGEFAENIPAWVVATMQENIENTGSLTGEMLHKIKDRYPVRFQLSGEHVKEIVSGRLVRKKEGSEEALPRVFEELQRAFKQLPFSRQDFTELYPVHPSTVELLDELRPLFSQHRGVVDFIHYRLAGDPGRGIPTFLDQSAAALLTPDFIFDHFRDRLRETVETSPYSEQVYRHYEREAGRLFPDAEDALTALKLLKLLILGALARAPKRFTAAELTGLLLHRFSGLESGVNYDYIAEIMDQLQTHGAYIAVTEDNNGAKLYTVDLKADVSLLLQKKLSQLTSAFTPGDPRILEGLLSWADEPYLPLKELQQDPLREKEISWQNTRRMGKVIFSLPAALSPELLQELEEELAGQETDFIFFMAAPTLAGESQSISPWKMREQCGPVLLRSLAMWVPREINAGEEEQLCSAYAHQKLQEEYASDSSPVGRQVGKHLENLLAEEKRKVKEIFRNIYFQGQLKAAAQMMTPSHLGYLPLENLISQAAAEILKERFPRHYEIRPQGEQVTGSLMQKTLDLLISPTLEGEELERGTRLVVENYLKPLGLVKKKGQGYLLEINPKTSPLTAEFLSLIPETGRASLERLYWKLRKGPFGFSAEGFRALGTAAILSGAVSAYQGNKRLAPTQVSYYRFWNIETVGPGTLIRPELQKILAEVPFLPARLRAGPLTFAAQQQVWEAATSFKEEWISKGTEIKSRVERLKEHRLFAMVSWGKLEKMLDRFFGFLDEIKSSYASREGLERFLAAYQSRPLIAADWDRLEAIYNFLHGDLPEILRLGHYLKDPELVVPEGEKYDSLQKRSRLLSELLEEEALLWEDKYRERLKREFKHFLDEYTLLYLEEHQQAVGPGRLKPYHAIMETKAYRLLEQLGRINAVMVKDDLVSINRQLAQPLERECRAAEELRLRERPLCSCGFTLGERVVLPEVTVMEEQILRGVQAYVAALQAPGKREKITAHAEHLELVGRRREASPLQEFLKISASGADLVSHLVELVNQNTVGHINRALTGDAIISERSVEELRELLADRVFTVEQLQELFQDWLMAGEGKPPDYIRVTRPNQKAGWNGAEGPAEETPGREPGQEARLFLEEKLPRLIPLAAQIGENQLFIAALLIGWLKFHRLVEGGTVPADTDALTEMERLIAEILEPKTEAWLEYREDLAELGDIVLSEKENLQVSFLERISAEATTRLSAEQLLEYYGRFGSGNLFRFDELLEVLVDEPFFPALSRAVAGKLAVQISSEEMASNLNIMAGTLKEAGKALAKEGIVLTELHQKEKRESLAVLHTLAGCNLLLREMERLAQVPPGDDKGWEKLYRLLAPFELLVSRLEELQARTLIPEVTVKRWRRRYASLLDPLLETFASYCVQPAPSRRQTLPGIFRQFSGWISKEGTGKGAYLILLDGARLDLWNFLLEEMLRKHRLELLRDGLLWAAQPTVTAAQLEPLKEEGLLGHILNMDEGLVSELISDPPAFLQAVDNERMHLQQGALLRAMKFDFVDDKIHASRDALPVLLEEVLLQKRKKLSPLLDCLPAGSLLLLAADHGFKTNLYFNKTNKDELLYLHGGASFFETLAPWALLKKK